MRIRRHNNTGMDWFFDKVFPKLFIGIFLVILSVILVQFAFIGWAGYQFVTNPEGSANFVGTIIGEAVRPVADAVRGE
jgi:TRAP-type C4-dicarboxylate transport system permease small subunit